MSLFRSEALEVSRGEWLGSILVATPLSRWVWAALAMSLAVAIVLLLVLGHYTRRETVAGQLVPSAGLLNLSATSAGLVAHIWVRDGQAIKKGDALIEISGEKDSAALGGTHALVGEQLNAQRARLQIDLQMQDTLATQQAKALRDKAALLQAQFNDLADQLALQKQDADNAERMLERWKPANAQGVISDYQFSQQRAIALQAQAQYKVLLRQQLDARQQLDTTQQQLSQLPLNAAIKRNDIERQLAETEKSVAQNEAQRAVVIRAPCDGVVSAVLFKDGQMVAAGQSMLSLLPAGTNLQAQLLVPSRAIGFIEPGNRVVLRYAAFPYQKFGQQYGSVAVISRSALISSDVQTLTGQQSQEPLYRIEVAIDGQQVMVYGKPEALKPGMAVNADILMEKRSLFEWLFEPLYGMAHHLQGGAHD